MSVTKLEDRPPYVRFETKSVEDREASIKAGHYVGVDVDYAFITPSGSKDVIERHVGEWFQNLREQVLQERLDPAWLKAFESMYSAFKEGKEVPVNGIPVINWPGLSPSQVKQLVSLNLRAVEDVAAMNEETIARIGMGARALKERAVAYLAAARDVGAVAETAAAAKVENEDLKRKNEELSAQVKQLAAQVAAIAAVQGQVQAVAKPSAEISASELLDDDLGQKL